MKLLQAILVALVVASVYTGPLDEISKAAKKVGDVISKAPEVTKDGWRAVENLANMAKDEGKKVAKEGWGKVEHGAHKAADFAGDAASEVKKQTSNGVHSLGELTKTLSMFISAMGSTQKE